MKTQIEKKLLHPIILTKDILAQEFGTASMEVINLDYQYETPQGEVEQIEEGTYQFGAESVISLFASQATLLGSVVIQQPQEFGVCSINLLDSSIKDSMFQRAETSASQQNKFRQSLEQISMQGMEMEIEEYVCQCPGELIINEIRQINCSLLDSDDD